MFKHEQLKAGIYSGSAGKAGIFQRRWVPSPGSTLDALLAPG